MISTMIAMIVILMICFLLIKLFNFKPYLTPITSISIVVVFMFFTSIFGLFYVATILFQIFIIILFLYQIIKHKKESIVAMKKMITPSIIIFGILTLCFLIFYYCVAATFTTWDEFSFWGTASKIIFDNKDLYSMFPNSLYVKSYFPGLPLLNNYFLLYENHFIESICFFAYSVVFSAVFAIPFKNASKKNIILIIMGLFLLLIFSIITKITFVSIYSDIMIGVLFAGAILIYYSEKNTIQKYISIIILLMFLTTTKDMGFVLSGLAIFIILIDQLFFNKKNLGNIFKKILMLSFFVILIYIVWEIEIKVLHLPVFNKIDLSHFKGIYDFIFLKENNFERIVFERFTYKLIYDKIFYVNIFIFPLSLLVISLVLFLKKNKTKYTKRIGLLMLSLFTVNILYYVLLYILYLISFLETEAYSLASFNRYMSTIIYATMIILIGLMILNMKKDKNNKVLIVVSFILFNTFLLYQSGFNDYKFIFNYNFHPKKNAVDHLCYESCSKIKKNSKILFISQNDVSANYHETVYQFLPNQTEGVPLYNYVPRYKQSKIKLSELNQTGLLENIVATWLSEEMNLEKFKNKIVSGEYNYVIIYNVDGYLKYILEPYLNGEELESNSIYKVKYIKNDLELTKL